MASRDVYSNSKMLVAMDSTNTSAEATHVGNIIDRAGFESVLFACFCRIVTTANGAYFVIQEGAQSDLSDAAIATRVQGAAVIDSNDDDNKVFRMGYRGGKRYIRLCVVTPSGVSAQYTSGIAILLDPASGPIAAQST